MFLHYLAFKNSYGITTVSYNGRCHQNKLLFMFLILYLFLFFQGIPGDHGKKGEMGRPVKFSLDILHNFNIFNKTM